MPDYLISQGTHRVVLRNYEGVITTYTEPSDYDSNCQCEDCKAGKKVEGVASLLNGDRMSLEPSHLARKDRNKHS